MFRIATFNLLGFSKDCPNDTDRRKDILVDALEQEHVNVALLQEVRTQNGRDGYPYHSTEEHLIGGEYYGKNARFVYGHQDEYGEEGVGILSTHRIVSRKTGILPKGLYSRAYLFLELEIEGDPVYVMTFHLEPPAIGWIATDLGATEEGQQEVCARQLEALESVMLELDPAVPVIVGGDFNVESDDPNFSRWKNSLGLQEIYCDTPDNVRKTFATHPSPSFQCGLSYRFDHLCYRNGMNAQLKVLAEGPLFHNPITSRSELYFGYLSDHIGVYADLTIWRRTDIDESCLA
ncbi:MAG: endonuclease/exonuclease/phosphatase family protein [Planctomycetota bacterium]|jgi:endonuclease/exonuclease/phosphatase family metal-dependent hydrolase